MIMSRRAVVAALVCVLPAFPFAAQAQKATPQVSAAVSSAVPGKTVAQVLDGYVEATGGKTAYLKIKSAEIRSTMNLPAQGIKGTALILAKAPNKVYTEQDVEGIGKSAAAFDGKVGWSKDTLQGVRTLSGVELESLKRDANFNSPVEWRTQYKKAELTGIKPVNGKDAYVVKLTPAVGSPVTQYHDVKSLLIVRVDSVQESPQGSIPVESYPSDYRAVNGVKMSYAGRIVLGPAEILMAITAVKVNVPIDDSKFVKPTE